MEKNDQITLSSVKTVELGPIDKLCVNKLCWKDVMESKLHCNQL